ncbi:hypothetical protein QBC39DRAFT_48238 [Podospora conica]|nr:hypothetical protein QBC39DRAFT_48238 [Schizothecium conicum]
MVRGWGHGLDRSISPTTGGGSAVFSSWGDLGLGSGSEASIHFSFSTFHFPSAGSLTHGPILPSHHHSLFPFAFPSPFPFYLHRLFPHLESSVESGLWTSCLAALLLASWRARNCPCELPGRLRGSPPTTPLGAVPGFPWGYRRFFVTCFSPRDRVGGAQQEPRPACQPAFTNHQPPLYHCRLRRHAGRPAAPPSPPRPPVLPADLRLERDTAQG